MLEFELGEFDIKEKRMLETFNDLGEAALSMSHYELASQSHLEDTAEDWKQFLAKSEVADYIKAEMELMQKIKLNKLISKLGKDNTDKSVGIANIIKVLTDMNKGSTKKEGPIFIYTYIKPNAAEMQAPNVRVLEDDPFLEAEGNGIK